jgi:hypothetical protein
MALRGDAPAGIHRIDPDLIARPGLELRLAVVALNAGRLRYVTQDGTIVEDDARTLVASPGGAGPVDLVEGVLASASVPLVFPPRPLAHDAYVDGGVLQNVPVRPAAELGASRIFAILAVPLAQPPDDRDFTAMNGVTVFMRAISAISFADRQKADLAHPLPPGARLTVIDPTVDVVGPFEVSQGLMLLDMDYGWCRAADVLADVDESTREDAAAATDAIVTGRMLAWYSEEELWAGRAVRAGDVERLRDIKRTVREGVQVREKLGLATPPDADRWWSQYEVHTAPRPAGLPAEILDER